jgi:hypothetical protein
MRAHSQQQALHCRPLTPPLFLEGQEEGVALEEACTKDGQVSAGSKVAIGVK